MDDGSKLNIRVGAIIVKVDKVLLTSDSRYSDSDPMLTVVGGRIKFAEDSYTALKRELGEELGDAIKSLGEGKFVGLSENFYKWQGASVHEYWFYYLFTESICSKSMECTVVTTMK